MAALTPSFQTLLSSNSNEWYTPSVYVEAARTLMGGIDLDPASCEEANQVVQATRYYTIEDDGLSLPFYSRVWLNPPYGRVSRNKSSAGVWSEKLIQAYRSGEVEQAVLLVNADTDTRWFHQLWSFPICFTLGRINFYTSQRTYKYGNTHGSAFIYLGPHITRFAELFSPFGAITTQFLP